MVPVPNSFTINPNPEQIPFPGPSDWNPGTPSPQLPGTRWESLRAFLDPTPQGRSRHTSVVIRNATSAERDAVIVVAGVQFIYLEKGAPRLIPIKGSKAKSKRARVAPKVVISPSGASDEPDPFYEQLSYMSGPADLEVPAGRATVFRATDPRHTVIEVRVAVKVRFGFEGREPYYTHDFFAYYNPTEAMRPPPPAGALDPGSFFLADVEFEFRTKRATQSIGTPGAFFELAWVHP